MSYFAKLNSENIVVAVYPGKDTDTEEKISERTGETYKKTSYTGSIRKNYAGIGYIYDASKDALYRLSQIIRGYLIMILVNGKHLLIYLTKQIFIFGMKII